MDNSPEKPSTTVFVIPDAATLLPGNQEGPKEARLNLIRAAERIGGAVGKVVHAGRMIRAKLDAHHDEGRSVIRDAAGGLQTEGVKVKKSISEISDNVMHYIRTHDAKDIGRDFERIAKRYPVQALTIAAAAGFFLERAIQKKRC